MPVDPKILEASAIACSFVTLHLNGEFGRLGGSIKGFVARTDSDVLEYLLLEFPMIMVWLAERLGDATGKTAEQVLQDLWLEIERRDLEP